MSKVTHISSSFQFNNLLSSNTYVVADFYADWCGPCKMIVPVFEQFAAAHTTAGHIAFAKVNVDAQQDIARTYGVSAMPTFIVFKNGRVTESIRGANPPALKTAVQKAVTDVAKGTAKDAEEKERAIHAASQSSGDGSTVSGGYALTSGSSWRMAL